MDRRPNGTLDPCASDLGPTLIRNIFRWLALVLLAYIGSALLAKPELGPVLRGTFIPTIHFIQISRSILVAVIGTTLSAYLYTWQSNQEVEEEIAIGPQAFVAA